MALQPTTRPALIAKHPQLIREALRSFGVSVRTLALDVDRGQLQIPPTTPPLLFDLRSLTAVEIAVQLCALCSYQRRMRIAPHLLVGKESLLTQRLIAGCPDLRAVVMNAVQIETLVTWLWAPLDLAPSQVWVNIDQPTILTQRPYLTQLMAALDGAVSVEHAAIRCAIAPNTAYRVLHECCGESPRRRSVEDWRAALVMALGVA